MQRLIEVHPDHFHLKAPGASYVIELVRGTYLSHAHWGAPLESWGGANAHRGQDRAFAPNPDITDRTLSLDTLKQEYPNPGGSDFRSPAWLARTEPSSAAHSGEFVYRGHRLVTGKPLLAGLPSATSRSRDDCETLELDLEDGLTGLKAILSYTVFRTAPVICRSVRFQNSGKASLRLERALSMSMDFDLPEARLLQLSGSWARERTVRETVLGEGSISLESRRGASSHQHNPFVAILSAESTEDHGEVRGFHLVYSGNFLAQAETDQFGTTRLQLGINPWAFSWELAPGESFQTPEVILSYSAEGLGGYSRQIHRFIRDHLCRGPWVNRERPILINNWEATYFDFNEEKLSSIVQKAAPLGVELFVLDDGWFGQRRDDRRALGDWVVNRTKLPGGLEGIAKTTRQAGMKFGLWFEPEMVSVDSDLYRAHPDWCIHEEGRTRSEGRSQLVLNLGRPEVRAHVIQSLKLILDSGSIDYVKWDSNRHLTECDGSTAHRHMLGLYQVLESITSAYPEILFESCSGGGGRFDAGMLYYMPQVWTSDNTDAVSRLSIQWGTSIAYPPATMGAHVSAVPNHQVGRMTSVKMRADVAMTGAFGYELDPVVFSPEEAREVQDLNAWYKANRRTLQFGDFHRLKSPASHDAAAWMSVAPDKTRAVAFWFQIMARANAPQRVLRLKGLDPRKTYRVSGACAGEWSGSELMGAGIRLPDLHGDYTSIRLELQAN